MRSLVVEKESESFLVSRVIVGILWNSGFSKTVNSASHLVVIIKHQVR